MDVSFLTGFHLMCFAASNSNDILFTQQMACRFKILLKMFLLLK